MADKKKQSSYDELRHKLDSDMLSASKFKTEIERRGFVNRTFINLHKARQEKQVSQDEYVKLINRLAVYRQGEYNDYIDILAGAAHMGMLEMAIQGEVSQLSPEAARERRQNITDITGVQPIEPDEK